MFWLNRRALLGKNQVVIRKGLLLLIKDENPPIRGGFELLE